jgi:hypothetical protein
MHELETLFYPLRVKGLREKPLFLPLEKKRATELIDLPDIDARQDSLFQDGLFHGYRRIFMNNLTYGYPAGLKRVRRGLPVLFYVNRIGVVGSGRVEDWYLDEPKKLYNQLDEMGFFDPEGRQGVRGDIRPHIRKGPRDPSSMVPSAEETRTVGVSTRI